MKHIVGFSGGIDSQACARWVLNRYPAEDVILLNSNAGKNEHPMTTEFIRQYSERVFPVTPTPSLVMDMWKTQGFAETKGLDGNAELDFGEMIRLKGRAPSRKAQFCTSILKLRPARRWVEANVIDEYERYAGVRRDESEVRKDTQFRKWDEFFDCYVNHPLADWTKQMCFEYVLQYKEPINTLYSLGFDRVGCAPCVNATKEDVRNWADRFPPMIDKVRDWETSTGFTFFAPCVPGIQLPSPRSGRLEAFNFIDEVVSWSRTDHGGRQFNILKTLERPACESKYGLCE